MEHEWDAGHESLAGSVRSKPLDTRTFRAIPDLTNAAQPTTCSSIKTMKTRRGYKRKYKSDLNCKKLICIGTNAAGLNTKRESLFYLIN